MIGKKATILHPRSEGHTSRRASFGQSRGDSGALLKLGLHEASRWIQPRSRSGEKHWIEEKFLILLFFL